ncbi:hypothetical protein Cde04nite_02810 [Cellulomonas denverensis]|nr:hypothetical protein Cde04nite_02810 [Cellulomonas denverensis]
MISELRATGSVIGRAAGAAAGPSAAPAATARLRTGDRTGKRAIPSCGGAHPNEAGAGRVPAAPRGRPLPRTRRAAT